MEECWFWLQPIQQMNFSVQPWQEWRSFLALGMAQIIFYSFESRKWPLYQDICSWYCQDEFGKLLGLRQNTFQFLLHYIFLKLINIFVNTLPQVHVSNTLQQSTCQRSPWGNSVLQCRNSAVKFANFFEPWRHKNVGFDTSQNQAETFATILSNIDVNILL
jgi:hypothetical protein